MPALGRQLPEVGEAVVSVGVRLRHRRGDGLLRAARIGADKADARLVQLAQHERLPLEPVGEAAGGGEAGHLAGEGLGHDLDGPADLRVQLRVRDALGLVGGAQAAVAVTVTLKVEEVIVEDAAVLVGFLLQQPRHDEEGCGHLVAAMHRRDRLGGGDGFLGVAFEIVGGHVDRHCASSPSSSSSACSATLRQAAIISSTSGRWSSIQPPKPPTLSSSCAQRLSATGQSPWA